MAFTRTSITAALNEAFEKETKLGSVNQDKINDIIDETVSAEKKPIKESMGGGVESAIANMYTYIDNLKSSNYIDPKQEKVLEKIKVTIQAIH